MGAQDFKYNMVPLFARKTGNINTSMFAAPKLALVPASRYYRDVTWSYHNVRGLLFKFVDFLYSRSEVFDRVLNVISSENIFFSLSFDV